MRLKVHFIICLKMYFYTFAVPPAQTDPCQSKAKNVTVVHVLNRNTISFSDLNLNQG